MPSTLQPSSELLDDDAILTLFDFAGWIVEYDDISQAWLVAPPNQKFLVLSEFANLNDALEYMLMYRKLNP